MTRRKPLPPDTRLSWRDPDMPVIRDYRMANGTRRIEVDPDYEHRYRGRHQALSAQPSFRDDPTYNLRKDRRK